MSHPARLSPLMAALGALIAGILAAPLLTGVPTLLPLLAMALCLGAAPALRRHHLPLAAALLIPVALFGALRARDAAVPSPSDVSHRVGTSPSLWVRGVVADMPETGSFGTVHYTLAVTGIEEGEERALRPTTGNLYVTQRAATEGAVLLFIGDAVRARGSIELPRPATNPGEFDFAAYLARHGVFATLVVKHSRDLERTAPAGLSLARAAGALRTVLTGATARSLPAGDAALLDGLLLSARSRLPADLADAFASTGTVHILSPSGLHLAALAGVLAALLRLLPPGKPVRAVGAIGGILLVWLYTLAAGAGPAPVRAALTITIFLLAPLLRRDADPLHSLAFAAFLLFACSPLALYDAGTELSFTTVGLLLLWLPPLERLWLPWEPGMGRRAKAARGVCLAVLAGLVAHLASWPLVAWHFGVVSLVAPVANLVVVPLSEALLLLGLGTAGITAALPGGAGMLLAPVWGLIHLLLALLRWLALAGAAPSWAAISSAPPPLWLLVVYYGLLGGSAPFVRRYALVKTLFAPGQRAG